MRGLKEPGRGLHVIGDSALGWDSECGHRRGVPPVPPR